MMSMRMLWCFALPRVAYHAPYTSKILRSGHIHSSQRVRHNSCTSIARFWKTFLIACFRQHLLTVPPNQSHMRCRRAAMRSNHWLAVSVNDWLDLTSFHSKMNLHLLTTKVYNLPCLMLNSLILLRSLKTTSSSSSSSQEEERVRVVL